MIELATIPAGFEESTPQCATWNIRAYEGGLDWHMVSEWYRAHGAGALQEVLLPPDGFVVQCDGEDLGALWVYFANGIGVGHVEWLVTRPWLSLAQSKHAIKHLVDFIWHHAQAHDYGALIFHAVPAAARVADYLGLTVAAKGQVTLIKAN